jgi:16S rRNA (guanine(966)-N(2))-methyltransferase RsmD
MRIIAGEFRSRRIRTPPGEATRPTPDRLRESLFNVLQHRIEGTVFVDAHAGSGAVGLEALSRGARQVIFIERNRAAIRVIRENLHTLNAAARARIIHGSAAAYLGSQQADIVFLDPPYGSPEEYMQCLSILGGNPPPLVIAQHATREPLEEIYGRLCKTRLLRQGDNSLSFYEAVE